MKGDKTREAERLLKDLNFFVAAGGDPEHAIPGVTSMGEATTAVARLKRELDALGVRFEWVGGRYVLAPEKT